MTDTQREREAETQAEGEAGSMQGARHGTQSWVPRIMPWVEGGVKPLSHWGCPLDGILDAILKTVQFLKLSVSVFDKIFVSNGLIKFINNLFCHFFHCVCFC